jgi:hypothetical protein
VLRGSEDLGPPPAARRAELGMAGDDDPGPPVRGGRVPEFRGGPAEDLLEQPEGVLARMCMSALVTPWPTPAVAVA